MANPLGLALADAMAPQAASFPGLNIPPPQAAPQGAPQMSKGQIIAGIIGDALAAAGGGPRLYTQMMMQRRQQQDQTANEQAQWGLRRQGELQDYEAKKQIDQRFPSERAPYRFEDNAGNVWELGQDGQPKRVFTDMAPKQYIQDGMLVTAPNPYNTGAAATPPPTITEDLWNSGKPVGGPTPPASGGFLRR